MRVGCNRCGDLGHQRRSCPAKPAFVGQGSCERFQQWTLVWRRKRVMRGAQAATQSADRSCLKDLFRLHRTEAVIGQRRSGAGKPNHRRLPQSRPATFGLSGSPFPACLVPAGAGPVGHNRWRWRPTGVSGRRRRGMGLGCKGAPQAAISECRFGCGAPERGCSRAVGRRRPSGLRHSPERQCGCAQVAAPLIAGRPATALRDCTCRSGERSARCFAEALRANPKDRPDAIFLDRKSDPNGATARRALDRRHGSGSGREVTAPRR